MKGEDAAALTASFYDIRTNKFIYVFFIGKRISHKFKFKSFYSKIVLIDTF